MFTSYVADFVKGKLSDQQWPKFRPQKGNFMMIDKQSRMVENTNPIPRKRIQFWMEEVFQHPEDILYDFNDSR